MGSPHPEWLLLLHQIPQSPQYLRAKTLRRLGQVGALALKNSAYILPSAADTEEDLRWIARDIRHGGGEAWLFGVSLVEGLTNEEVIERFRQAREADYADLARRGRETIVRVTANPAARIEALQELRKLREQRQALARIDFFAAPGADELEAIMSELSRQLEETARPATPGPGSGLSYKGHRWVTRSGVKIDRLASAWLIRRFFDPEAGFAFVDPSGYEPLPGDLRFDMFDGEFSHEGDECTFEVLLRKAGLVEPALRAVADVVHDLDLKEQRFGRPETDGVGAMIAGILASSTDDERRLSDGATLFDALYSAFCASTLP